MDCRPRLAAVLSGVVRNLGCRRHALQNHSSEPGPPFAIRGAVQRARMEDWRRRWLWRRWLRRRLAAQQRLLLWRPSLSDASERSRGSSRRRRLRRRNCRARQGLEALWGRPGGGRALQQSCSGVNLHKRRQRANRHRANQSSRLVLQRARQREWPLRASSCADAGLLCVRDPEASAAASGPGELRASSFTLSASAASHPGRAARTCRERAGVGGVRTASSSRSVEGSRELFTPQQTATSEAQRQRSSPGRLAASETTRSGSGGAFPP